MQSISENNYHSKRMEVLERFKREFVNENLHTDSTFRIIIEMLILDTDPYEIIERLITDRKSMMQNFIELVEKSRQPIYIQNK